jgi:hypothetical protein
MTNSDITQLSLAVRVYPEPAAQEEVRPKKFDCGERPEAMLVLDAETRPNAMQSSLFLSCRFFVNRECLEEALVCGDGLSSSELDILKAYVEDHEADITRGTKRKLLLLSRREFLKKFYRYAYKSRCLVVGFNLPFDLSRFAFDVSEARGGRFSKGFSLGIWTYIDKHSCEHRNQFRPRILIKHIDSKRALKGFTARNQPDAEDLLPDGLLRPGSNRPRTFRGHFLDLRTLAFALTDRGHSLESACKAFGIEHCKLKAATHGVISEEYINYNRRDVKASAELAFKLLEEFDKHPIDLRATEAYSPASIGKAYLRRMRIRPVLQRQPTFSKYLLGFAQTSYFGGRTSAHIRKFPVPVVHTDFLSMYPTVNSLMGLWQFGEFSVSVRDGA